MSIPKIYTDENAARSHLEGLLWPNGPVCPHCGVLDEATRLHGKSTRPGLLKCRACEKPFSVTVGTVMERSKIKLHQWVYAAHLLTSSKKGISAHQIGRMFGLTYKSAWFLCHRIREAMRDDRPVPMGGSGSIVESDETFFGTKEGFKKRRGGGHKMVVLSLVQRGGAVRSFHIGSANKAEIFRALATNVRRETKLMTDTASYYKRGIGFKNHEMVNHEIEEYVRGDAHVNTLEGYFSIFKRGMKGVYQHCSEKHLHRYLSEFDFRYSQRIALGVDDAMRADIALKGVAGKRLTYRRPH